MRKEQKTLSQRPKPSAGAKSWPVSWAIPCLVSVKMKRKLIFFYFVDISIIPGAVLHLGLFVTFSSIQYELGTWNFERLFTSLNLLHVTCHVLHVMCYMSCVTCHVSQVTWQMLCVTCIYIYIYTYIYIYIFIFYFV